TATCPANTRLIGGGARTTPASVGNFKTIASFPTFNNSAHDFGKKAAADGETNPDSWTAVGWDGGSGNSSNEPDASAIWRGTTTASDWPAATHTGGQASASTYSDVWALCANDGV